MAASNLRALSLLALSLLALSLLALSLLAPSLLAPSLLAPSLLALFVLLSLYLRFSFPFSRNVFIFIYTTPSIPFPVRARAVRMFVRDSARLWCVRVHAPVEVLCCVRELWFEYGRMLVAFSVNACFEPQRRSF